MRRFIPAALLALILPSVALAEPSKEEVAKAIALFKEGRALDKAGDIAAACSKFEESQKLAPAPGTQLNIAVCHAQLGRDLDAYRELKIGIARAVDDKRADREEIGRDWLKKVESRIGFVTITRAEATSDVFLDGAPVTELDVEQPLAPGTHTVDAKSAGKKPWSASLEWAAGEHKKIEIPALESNASATIGAPSTPVVAVIKDVGATKDASPPPRSDAWRSPVGIAGMAVGAIGVGVGGYLFFKSSSLHSSAQDLEDQSAFDAARSKQADAKTARTWSLVGLGAGAAIGAVGAWIFFGASKEPAPATTMQVVPMVGPQGGGLALGGAF